MSVANEMTILFKHMLNDIQIGKYSNNNDQLNELSETLDEEYKKTIVDSLYSRIKYILLSILISNIPKTSTTTDLHNVLDVFPAILEKHPDLITTFLNTNSYDEFIGHFSGIFNQYELINIMKYMGYLFHKNNNFDTLTKNLKDDNEILHFFSNELKLSIIIFFENSYNWNLYLYNYDSLPVIVLYKHDNGKYTRLNRDAYCIEYYFNNILTKKNKVHTLFQLRELLHYFYSTNIEYVKVMNKITDALYDKELEWFDYAICEAIFHRFDSLYRIYVKS